MITKFFVSLPTNESHENSHPTGILAGPAQKVHPVISKKIEDLVQEGSTNPNEIQRALREFMRSEGSAIKPSPTDRAYYPTTTDISNHMYKAKVALQLSKFDQENLALKIEEWKKLKSDEYHFFRPYVSEAESEESSCKEPASGVKCTQNLLWVHQQQWQRELLNRYGNHISLIDATYRTMKYKLPLFFVCVRTNVGYSVVAQFIVQTESVECITEALNVLKQWNPNWNPPFFLSDFSDAEFAALKGAFPDTTVYGCDFHREQAWTRWVQDRKNGLDRSEADSLLHLLRACAWAPPGMNDSGLDDNYQKAIYTLKESAVWKTNVHVQNWLNSTWLSHPEVSIHTTNVACAPHQPNSFHHFRDGHVLSETADSMQLLTPIMVQRLRTGF